MTKKENDIEKLEKIIQEASNLKTAYEEKNGIASTRISNKDILFWLVTKHFEQDTQIAKLGNRVKILEKLFFGAIVAIIVNIVI